MTGRWDASTVVGADESPSGSGGIGHVLAIFGILAGGLVAIPFMIAGVSAVVLGLSGRR